MSVPLGNYIRSDDRKNTFPGHLDANKNHAKAREKASETDSNRTRVSCLSHWPWRSGLRATQTNFVRSGQGGTRYFHTRVADMTYNTSPFPSLPRTLSPLVQLNVRRSRSPPIAILGYKERDPDGRSLWGTLESKVGV